MHLEHFGSFALTLEQQQRFATAQRQLIALNQSNQANELAPTIHLEAMEALFKKIAVLEATKATLLERVGNLKITDSALIESMQNLINQLTDERDQLLVENQRLKQIKSDFEAVDFVPGRFASGANKEKTGPFIDAIVEGKYDEKRKIN